MIQPLRPNTLWVGLGLTLLGLVSAFLSCIPETPRPFTFGPWSFTADEYQAGYWSARAGDCDDCRAWVWRAWPDGRLSPICRFKVEPGDSVPFERLHGVRNLVMVYDGPPGTWVYFDDAGEVVALRRGDCATELCGDITLYLKNGEPYASFYRNNHNGDGSYVYDYHLREWFTDGDHEYIGLTYLEGPDETLMDGEPIELEEYTARLEAVLHRSMGPGEPYDPKR